MLVPLVWKFKAIVKKEKKGNLKIYWKLRINLIECLKMFIGEGIEID